MLFVTSVYYSINKIIQLFSYSFHVPCIILSNVYFYIVRSLFPFLFEAQKYFCSFQLFENGHIHNVVSTLIYVMKLDVENNSIVSTLSNTVNIIAEIDNVDLTLFNVVNFNVDIHNIVSTSI